MKALSKEFLLELRDDPDFMSYPTLPPSEWMELNSFRTKEPMNTVFTKPPRKAKLELTYDDGTVQVVDFYVRNLDLTSDLQTMDMGYGRAVSSRSCNVKLDGLLDPGASFVTPGKKKEKPVPKPKAPTVKTSSLRLRKADRAATIAAKKLTKLEAALQHAKVTKGLADTERKLATEALLASAIA